MLRWVQRLRLLSNTHQYYSQAPTRFATTKASPSPAEHNARLFDRPLKYFIYAYATVVTGHAFWCYGYSFDQTYGISMLPTIASWGDWAIISKYYRRGRDVQVGDIISFKHPVRQGEYMIKRVLALSGDLVLMNTPGKSDAMLQVPEGHCWVVGDNLQWSRDSRMFGPLPLALISGKVIAKFNWHSTLPEFERLENGLQPFSDDDDLD